MFNKYRLHIFSLITGALIGYIVFHPYTMLVYSLMHVHNSEEIHLHWKGVFNIAQTIFEPSMLPMAITFTCFGGVLGLLIGIIVDKKRKLYDIKHENEKKEVALKTLNRLMVTLSHYLLNISMIIGGEVRLTRKACSEKEAYSSLGVIEEQARKIDAVIGALKKVTKIKTTDYTSEGHALMLDIAEDMEKFLKETKNVHKGDGKSL